MDLLIIGARIVTMDPRRPRAERIGIWKGLIIGLDEELDGLRFARTIDARGMTLMPGFHDSHNHMSTFGRSLINIDASGLSSLDELYAAIRERHEQLPEGEWVVADSYNQHRLGGHPTRQALDTVAPGRSIIVNHNTTHLLVASTPVFERVGALSADWPVPSGGFIERDEGGEATGLVGEQAMGPFRDLTRPHSIDALAAAIGRASDHFLAEGITSVVEAGIGNSPVVGSSPIELAPYQLAAEDGRLGVRAQLMVSMENLKEVTASPDDLIDLGIDLGLRTGLGDDKLSIGALKMFTDGAIGSRTAALTTPFCDHDSTGVMQFGEEELQHLATSAARAGWQLAVHAIGDHAVDVALGMIARAREAAPTNTKRHRIEHASIVRDDQLPRMAELGVIASTQPQFVSSLGDAVLAGVGDREAWTYRHRSIMDAGVRLACGSDRPVVSGNPLTAIRDMVMRRTSSGRSFSPDECVDVHTALVGYTRESAFAVHREDRLGRLSAGFHADFVLLDGDPLTAAPETLPSIPIAATAVGGALLFDPSGIAGR
ncbi:amidohydrolase [Leucobacter manosquensis]|uniref:Amidohydrolase n=1 Tax=Leucobacter manosquensis TaxID=2810611 RepID=A0ABS5M6H5_9MICO|nr:amidohydrolase [Leucobacter manosquensis]MBS3182445.1 amidohydrolase [Leucobacter manosquensis]